MARLPPPIHSFSELGHPHPAEPLSNLDNAHPHLREPRLPPQPHCGASGWRPATIDEFNTWNASPQGMFPLTLIGPGQNPNQDLLPRRQPRHPAHTTNNTNLGKRKRATASPVETSSVGGYGPLSPGETTTETATEMNSPSPSPPPYFPRNTAYDLWPFARPLESNDELPLDQWPTSVEPHLMRKPKSPWFGCKLCSQFGYAISLSTFGISTLILVRFSDRWGVKQWRVFRNDSKSSPTTPFRRHLKDHHASVWAQECTRLNIPVPSLEEEVLEPTPDTPETEPFTLGTKPPVLSQYMLSTW